MYFLSEWSITRTALSPLLFNFALEYVMRNVRVNDKGLQCNGTHHLLVYAVNFLGEIVHNIKKALVTRREVGFSNWVLSRDVRGSKRRKCVMVAEFYWRPEICR
jgi:hypothetical protein